jgi:small subunit ribosomal protein S5
VRAVVESAGIHDILSKCLGSSNKYNVVHATVAALKRLRSAERVAEARGMSIDIVAGDYPVAAASAHASTAASIVGSQSSSSGGTP